MSDDLQKSEPDKTAILDSLLEHVVYHDREMRILWANRAACESAHMKREDLLGRFCHEVWFDRRSPCEDCPVVKARETGKSQLIEKKTPDGRWWFIQGHPIRDSSGQVTGTTEIALDITGLKIVEETIRQSRDDLERNVKERTVALKEANEKLRQEIALRRLAEKERTSGEMLLASTFSALQDLVMVIDSDLRVVMSNWRGHEHIPERERRKNPHCYAVFMHRETPCRDCHTREVLATGEVRVFEQTNAYSGRIKEVQVVPIKDDRQKVIMVVEHLRDITEQKQIEDQVHLLAHQLLKAQEIERQMLARELHDTIAQELSAAKIEADLIYKGLSSDGLPQAANIRQVAKILQKTILGVRTMAYDLRPPGLEELGLVETIYQFCEDFTHTWGIPVDFRSAGVKNLELSHNTQINLYRLVQEGLTNVRKHAAASQVTLRLTAAFPKIILRIEDDGCGFDVQKRAKSTGQEKRMGLRSMQERVNLLNGEMILQSNPGLGTKVTIRLPLAEIGE